MIDTAFIQSMLTFGIIIMKSTNASQPITGLSCTFCKIINFVCRWKINMKGSHLLCFYCIIKCLLSGVSSQKISLLLDFNLSSDAYIWGIRFSPFQCRWSWFFLILIFHKSLWWPCWNRQLMDHFITFSWRFILVHEWFKLKDRIMWWFW